jgi:hypothetical protein
MQVRAPGWIVAPHIGHGADKAVGWKLGFATHCKALLLRRYHVETSSAGTHVVRVTTQKATKRIAKSTPSFLENWPSPEAKMATAEITAMTIARITCQTINPRESRYLKRAEQWGHQMRLGRLAEKTGQTPMSALQFGQFFPTSTRFPQAAGPEMGLIPNTATPNSTSSSHSRPI